jgi:hypothetical protein
MPTKPQIKQPNITCEEIMNKHSCPTCLKLFGTKSNLTRHINGNYCQVRAEKDKQDTAKMLAQCLERIERMDERFDERFNQFKEEFEKNYKPTTIQQISNQNLNVMCLGSKDNMLDILTARTNPHKALTFVKDSALNRLRGDCTILEKVYILDMERPAIMYANGSKIQYVYYDENDNRVVETNVQIMAKKLADNLQRTYLKGMGALHIDLADNLRDDNDNFIRSKNIQSIEAHDIQTMNEHVHELQDEKYQKKVLKSLKIPYESDIINKGKVH